MRSMAIALLAAGLCVGAGHAGEILRCVGAGGDVTYTNLDCPANTQSHHVSSYVPVPDAPPSKHDLAAQEAALAASRAEQAAARAEAAARYQAANYYEAPVEPERGGPYHQSEDNNVYYPAYFGGYPLLGAANGNRVVHHTTSARRIDHGGDHFRGVHPQPVKFYGGPGR